MVENEHEFRKIGQCPCCDVKNKDIYYWKLIDKECCVACFEKEIFKSTEKTITMTLDDLNKLLKNCETHIDSYDLRTHVSYKMSQKMNKLVEIHEDYYGVPYYIFHDIEIGDNR